MDQPRKVEKPAPLLPFLFESWPDSKKKQVREWLKHGMVLVNGHIMRQFDHALRPGDAVAIRQNRHAPADTFITGGIKIRYEDAELLVIEKPADLLSIASEGEQTKTAYFLLTDYLRNENPKSRERIWVVHRLDRETSGLMVFAKTAQAKTALQQHWDEYEKRYLAVAEGKLKADKGKFDSYLDEANPYKVFVVPRSETARRAITHYTVMKKGRGVVLVELRLETGRRHQIRVQLADAGCPVVGDVKYGAKTDPAKRLALHSCALRFQHPVTGKEMAFQSPLPKELARLV
ncbi:MAG TPA: RluA family pseudouridine synthase [Chthoniobacteraceae bacterium]|nr:RluA family pseudouridine synthase [Chthoniobacteraceae bacterium]